MEHLQEQIHQLMVAMQQRDEQVANLQLQINQAEENHAGALVAAQEAANNAIQALNANANADFVSQNKELIKIFSFVPDFNGNNLKIFSFIKSVETILPQVQNFDNDLVIQAIKSKIFVDVLETAPSETWEQIKQCLLLHFSDKRDEAALIRDLHKLSNSTSVDEFYGKVEKMLMLLINRAKLLDAPEILPTKIEMYQNMATKVFVGDIKGFIGSSVRSQKPKSLNEALLLYNEEKNCQDDSPHNVQPQVQNKPKIIQQQLPIRNYQFPTHQQFPFQQHIPFQQQFPFQEQLPFQHYPFQQQLPYQQQYPFKQQSPYPIKFPTQQQFPNQQKKMLALPKPTPMEIDHSIRSKQINYANRNPDLKNFKIEELRNLNTNEVEEETFQPEQANVYYNDTSEIENTEENFLVTGGENPQI